MVLAWTMDKAGPMCRSAEDCALVFNVIHGADEKDPSSLTTPFQFDRNIDVSRLRIGYVVPAQGRGGGAGRGGAAADTAAQRRAQEAATAATQGFLDKLKGMGAKIVEVGARPSQQGFPSALGMEDAAAFEAYADSVARDSTDSLDYSRRFVNGRESSALAFLQSQRRRLVLMKQMAEFMKDLDMYIVQGGDVGLTNQTGHPAVVFPYRMSEGQFAQPQVTTIIGQLFADDKIISVAHAYQKATDWHLRRPKLA